jgi:hypothetical protein
MIKLNVGKKMKIPALNGPLLLKLSLSCEKPLFP